VVQAVAVIIINTSGDWQSCVCLR